MRTVNPKVVACVCALLIIFQMAAGPVSLAFAGSAADTGCDHAGTVHAWHEDEDCGDHSQARDDSESSQHHSGSMGQCHCVHSVSQTLVVSSLMIVAALPAETEAFASVLRGPAYSAPLFEFLRPPN